MIPDININPRSESTSNGSVLFNVIQIIQVHGEMT